MPDPPDRLPDDPEPRYSEGQESDDDTAEKNRVGDFASREASADRIGPLGEPGAHDDRAAPPDRSEAGSHPSRPGAVAGDALPDDATAVPADADDVHDVHRTSRLRGDLTAGLTDVVIGPDFDESDRHPGGDDQEDRPEQERHRRFSEGQEYDGETVEKERTGDFATGQREDDDDL